MITRKLHATHTIAKHELVVQLCKLVDIQRASKLVSSTDGIVALEVRTRARPTIQGWEAVFQRTIVGYPDPPLNEPYPLQLAELAARAAFESLGRVAVDVIILEVALAVAKGAAVQSGWLFPFRVGLFNRMELDRTLHGLPCDPPVTT